jgi:hypothetical protein
MNMRWSLDELYTSFDSEEFKNDMIEVDKLIDEVKKWSETNLKSKDNPVDKIEYYLNTEIKLNTLLSKLMIYSNLTISVDARNEQALKAMDKLVMKSNELTEPSVKFKNGFPHLII